MEKISNITFNIYVDTKYFSKPKIRQLMSNKTLIMKRIIDVMCLFHNLVEFKSIVPHPEFQDKGGSSELIYLELLLLDINKEITLFIDWEKIEYLKDIFKYFIKKILNQEKEGIIQLKEDEYTFHIGLYRSFGIYINSFCFNFSFNNKCSLIKSIEYVKEEFFESKKQLEIFVDVILKDYFKFFGFIAACKNNFFNYYDTLLIYSNLYSSNLDAYNVIYYLTDFSLLKYLFILPEKKIDFISYFKNSNIENVYSLFINAFNIFNEKEIENKEKNKKKITSEETKKEEKVEEENKSKNTINEENISEDNNLQFIQMLRSQNNNHSLRQIINILNYNKEKNDRSRDEYNCIMQWRFLLDILISFMKDDSSPYYNLLSAYSETISSQTKRELFNVITNNKYTMVDLNNILKEKLIHEIIAKGNYIDLKIIKKEIHSYLQNIFEKNEFSKILDELTHNKVNEDTKIFYLKDEYLKFVDINYYFSFKDKSSAQRYILDFKKDNIKSYNHYYYNPSELTFEFYQKVYETIFLNKNNLELMIIIVEKLLGNEKITEFLDIKSLRNSLLPIILNYLSMFSVINSKSFIEFKIKNSDLIKKLYELLSKFLKNNKNNQILEKDLEDNVKDIINQLNNYEIIYESVIGDLNKINNFNYNTDIIEKIQKEKLGNQEEKSKINIIPTSLKKVDENKIRKINMKDKYKHLMKKKANKFMDKVNSNKEMIKAMEEQSKIDSLNCSNNEIMCFYCRNPIILNSFKVPYGKIGLLIEDYFYINSIKATLRTEIIKILGKNQSNSSELFNKIKEYVNRDIYKRINSCGHYFHISCFLQGKKNNEDNEDENEFTCPLCLKKQNILIPPLNDFKEKYNFFKSENLNELFTTEIDIDKAKSKICIDCSELDLFKDIINIFVEWIDLNILKHKNYQSFLDYKCQSYQALFNNLENTFYINGTYFHKSQQIDNLQNIILSLRFLVKTNPLYIKQIIIFIKNELTNIAKGTDKNDYIYSNNDYMHYANSLDKIFLSLIILFNYEEIKETFKYIIYLYLPYFLFGFYFRDLIFKKEYNKLDNGLFKEKMNIKDLAQYLKDNNNLILNYFTYLLKKISLIKVISDFNNKNQDIINSFNEFTLENLFSLINMEILYNLLPKNEKNEIIVMDIIDNLPKIFNQNDVFYKEFGEFLEFHKILDSIFNNVKNNEKEELIIEKDLIIQFCPIKFQFSYLDNNIFDFIETNTGKECDICHKIPRNAFLCLICGDKICKNNLGDISKHTIMCGNKNCIFLDMDKTEIFIFKLDFPDNIKLNLFPIYLNDAGVGPKDYIIERNFNLSHEKLNQAIKIFINNDL